MCSRRLSTSWNSIHPLLLLTIIMLLPLVLQDVFIQKKISFRIGDTQFLCIKYFYMIYGCCKKNSSHSISYSSLLCDFYGPQVSLFHFCWIIKIYLLSYFPAYRQKEKFFTLSYLWLFCYGNFFIFLPLSLLWNFCKILWNIFYYLLIKCEENL